jgi:hypothetical protein
MDEVCLTREQLKAITGGKRPKEIIQWLRTEGFTFRVDLNGWPIVHPDHYAQMLGVRPVPVGRPKAGVNLDHLKRFVEARDAKKRG